jgi:hypothetical protein
MKVTIDDDYRAPRWGTGTVQPREITNAREPDGGTRDEAGLVTRGGSCRHVHPVVSPHSIDQRVEIKDDHSTTDRDQVAFANVLPFN